jgi:hypothetical protein
MHDVGDRLLVVEGIRCKAYGARRKAKGKGRMAEGKRLKDEGLKYDPPCFLPPFFAGLTPSGFYPKP